VVGVVKSIGIEPIRVAYRCPWRKPIAQRWIGSCRREVLDHVIVLNEDHLRRLVQRYVNDYHSDPKRCGLAKQTPLARVVTPRPARDAEVVALPRVGGLRHRYGWRHAA
jgi:hypothetical protein